MNARAGRPSALAGVAVAVLAVGGCGGSSQPHPKHAGSAAPGLRAGSGGSRGPSSTAASSGTGAGSSAGTTGTTGTSTSSTASSARTVSVSTTGTPVPRAGSAPAAKLTFAAPGGESPAQFVGSADAICRGFRARARAIGAAANTLGAQETELKHLLAATEQAVKALTDLSPPTADAPGLRRFAEMTVGSVIAFADAQSRTSSTSEAAGSAVEAKDLADSKRSSEDAAAAQAAARKLGLHVCGSPGSAWL
jgi:hypothetical protein